MIAVDIKKLNDLTGQILRSEEKVNALKYRLLKLKNTDSCFTAEVKLRIGASNFESRERLNLEEILSVLERRVSEEEVILQKLKQEYESLK